jgi:transcriptional regulator with GAF, ATPase, and Fis domain
MATGDRHSGAGGDVAGQLQAVQATIERQQRELAELRAEVADAAFAAELREALVRRAASGRLAAPTGQSELLGMILRTAARVISAEAGALFLLDPETNELLFEAALVETDASAGRFRIPVGQGIAGWVAATGQPVAISDASQDPRFAETISRSVGYVPKSVLCIPLYSHEAMGGVIQLCDKNGGRPFTAVDMELLGQFASQAAAAIEQSRALRDLSQLFCVVLEGLLPGMSEEEALQRALETSAPDVTDHAAASEHYREALQITHLISEVSQHGPQARRICCQIMASVAEYVRAQASQNAAAGWLR